MPTKEEFKNKIKEMKIKMKEEIIAFFQTQIRELFVKHENLENFSWTQYTDYFNDGDTCHFHTRFDERMKINGISYDDYCGETWETSKEIEKYTKADPLGNTPIIKALQEKLAVQQTKEDAVKVIYNDICSVLNVLDDVDYYDMFGDHVKVTVEKDGITTEEYTRHD